ncbi:MAG: cation:dicarboxylase symporter family transporter [Bacteroidetes bacterium]|nr:cation:dicarboxylase symporter family transporter [Bacteroidota bacterium]MBS1632581.1 cation:dicarboxylase symporter family transporter [Bacteroidota bacterium]
MKKLFINLSFWVLLSIIAGILVGQFAPKVALYPILQEPWKTRFLGQELELGTTLSEFLGKLFISIVKLFINPIIFLTITLGIINMGNLKKVGRIGVKALFYFEVVSTFALIAGIVVALLVQPGHGVITSVSSAPDISKYANVKSFNWIHFFKENSTLQVLTLALLSGIIISQSSYRLRVIAFLQPIAKVIFTALHKVMLLAPIGAFGGMAFTISKYGVSALVPLAKLMGTVYATMAVFIFLVLWLILKHYKVSIFKLLKYIREELLIVLGTSSSESVLPNLMEKLERMGCSKPVVGLVVPAGYSFNLDGTTIYLSMAMIFLAQAFHIHLSIGQIFTIIGILMVTSKGAAGVAGSGFVVLASTITAIKVIPMEGLVLLLGVDRFMSEARAITNFIGNSVATIWIANNENEFNRKKMKAAFDNVEETENIVMDNLTADTVIYKDD